MNLCGSKSLVSPGLASVVSSPPHENFILHWAPVQQSNTTIPKKTKQRRKPAFLAPDAFCLICYMPGRTEQPSRVSQGGSQKQKHLAAGAVTHLTEAAVSHCCPLCATVSFSTRFLKKERVLKKKKKKQPTQTLRRNKCWTDCLFDVDLC